MIGSVRSMQELLSYNISNSTNINKTIFCNKYGFGIALRSDGFFGFNPTQNSSFFGETKMSGLFNLYYHDSSESILLVGNKISKLYKVNTSPASPLISFTDSTQLSTNIYLLSVRQQSDTNYIIAGAFDPSMLLKYDATLPGSTSMANVTVNGTVGIYEIEMRRHQSEAVITDYRTSKTLYNIDISSMNITYSYSFPHDFIIICVDWQVDQTVYTNYADQMYRFRFNGVNDTTEQTNTIYPYSYGSVSLKSIPRTNLLVAILANFLVVIDSLNLSVLEPKNMITNSTARSLSQNVLYLPNDTFVISLGLNGSRLLTFTHQTPPPACGNGRYFHSPYDACIDLSEIPLHYGADNSSSATRRCTVANCSECKFDFSTCTRCETLYYLYRPNSTCYDVSSMPDRLGPDQASKEAVGCFETGCLKCRSDFKACECFENECVKNFDLQMVKTSYGDSHLVFNVSTSTLGVSEMKEYWKSFVQQFKLIVKCSQDSEDVGLNVEYWKLPNQTLIVGISFEATPVHDRYEISAQVDQQQFFIHQYYRYVPLGKTFNLTWNNSVPSSQLKVSLILGSAGGVMTGGFGDDTKGKSIANLLNFIESSDPSGVFTKLFQSIKITSRFLYLNIKYGPLLSTFLESADQSAGIKKEPSIYQMNKLTRSSLGKLTKQRLLVSLRWDFWVKIVLYAFSWILKVVSALLSAFQVKLGRAGLGLMYILPKLHMIVFNFVLMDFSMYIPHMYLHSNQNWKVVLYTVIYTMVCLDVLYLVRIVLSHEEWVFHYYALLQDKIQNEVLSQASAALRDNKEFCLDDYEKLLSERLKRSIPPRILKALEKADTSKKEEKEVGAAHPVRTRSIRLDGRGRFVLI